MILDHAYPDLEKNEENDLLALYHMDNETLIVLSRYHKNHPESKTKAEFFGFIKSADYQDPDLADHLKWRSEEEMKEKSAEDELKKLEYFKATRNEWFTKEEKKKRSRKTTPKVQVEEGSSSQPKKKRQKKVVKTLLVDEPEEDEPEANVERNEDPTDGENEDDDLYIPSPEHVQEVQTPPSEGIKKSNSRKRVVTPKVAKRLKILLKNKPIQEPSQPPSPPPEPQQPLPLQSPPKQPSPPHQLSPPHQPSPQSSPHLRIATPLHDQPVITSQHFLQTPPTTQPLIQTTPSSAGFKDFPSVPENIQLEDIGDFNFVTNDVVKKLQQKVDDVLVENKKLIDLEKKLEKRVKTVKTENLDLLKRVEADQTDIDILKVRIAELEEEKTRRDEQNEYFKLKNKELEAINAKKEHKKFMLNKVLESLIGKSMEQRFEEIQLEEVRARCKAKIEVEMKNKGKGVQSEGVIEVSERAIVPAIVPESPIQNPHPISVDDEEEDDDEGKKDDADDVFSASSHDDDDDGNDDDQGTSGIKVTEESNEENVDDYLQDDANEEPENVEGEGEHVDDKNDDDSEKLILRLERDIEEGEIRRTYTLDEIIKLTHIDENEFKFDFEEELNEFDINQQHEYEYKYL
ncbi:hypothetical protein Hanom_Chr17g01583781 [Helianthus anomalus]